MRLTLHLTYQYFNQFIYWVTLVLVSYLITATCTNHGLALTTLMTCSAFSWTGDPLSGEAAKGNKIIVSTIFVTQGTSDNLTCNQAFFFFFTAGRREKECLILILHMLSACSPESGPILLIGHKTKESLEPTFLIAYVTGYLTGLQFQTRSLATTEINILINSEISAQRLWSHLAITLSLWDFIWKSL